VLKNSLCSNIQALKNKQPQGFNQVGRVSGIANKGVLMEVKSFAFYFTDAVVSFKIYNKIIYIWSK
jgi:hypothetical protein